MSTYRPGLQAVTGALALTIIFMVTVASTTSAHAQSLQVLYSFTGGNDGAQPYAGLTMGGDGSLYGTTHSGNQGTNWGNVYRLYHHNSNFIFQALMLFDGQLEARPVFGPENVLYDTAPIQLTGAHSGYVFTLQPPINVVCHIILCLWNPTVIYQFSGGSDGNDPRFGPLVFDHAGNMYDTTSMGGTGDGVVWEMMGSGQHWTEQPIHTFSGQDGSNPLSGVVFDGAGNLYGTTSAGGTNGFGTVYELSPSANGWTQQVLYSFQNGSDGKVPAAPVVVDSAGNVYGSTITGGTGGGGTVFELSPSSGGFTYQTLYSFTGSTNCGPWGSMTLQNGSLYGTSVCDGAFGQGNVFELTPSGNNWTYSSIYDFMDELDGAYPYCNITFDSSGNMFGTAFKGGSENEGTIWEISPPFDSRNP
jgi:uncharacterized repeat protein (TIGR03803 family)